MIGARLGVVLAGSLAASPVSNPQAEPPPAGVAVTRKGTMVRPPRIEPWFAASSKMMFRALTLEQGGEIQRERDTAWKPVGLWLGAQGYYRRGRTWATGGLRGDLALGVELMSLTGSAAVGVSHTTGYAWHVRPRFNVFVGGRVTMSLDPANFDQSHLELGVPIGASWRRVELQWVPAISIPLAQRTRPVFDGELRRRVAVQYMPINVVLSFGLGRHRTAKSRD